MNRIKVLVVDDSALMRKLLTEFLARDPAIQVVGSAPDPLVARDKIKQLSPDVLTLDVEMPRMDGLTFLENLMRLRPMPVVMVSSLTERGAEVTLQALELGAVDFVAKPQLATPEMLDLYAEEVAQKVRAAAAARVARVVPRQRAERLVAGPVAANKLIVIGASTGGTEALREIL